MLIKAIKSFIFINSNAVSSSFPCAVSGWLEENANRYQWFDFYNFVVVVRVSERANMIGMHDSLSAQLTNIFLERARRSDKSMTHLSMHLKFQCQCVDLFFFSMEIVQVTPPLDNDRKWSPMVRVQGRFLSKHSYQSNSAPMKSSISNSC